MKKIILLLLSVVTVNCSNRECTYEVYQNNILIGYYVEYRWKCKPTHFYQGNLFQLKFDVEADCESDQVNYFRKVY